MTVLAIAALTEFSFHQKHKNLINIATQVAHKTDFSVEVSLELVEMSSTVLSVRVSHDDLRPRPAVYRSSGFRLNALSYLNDTGVHLITTGTLLITTC